MKYTEKMSVSFYKEHTSNPINFLFRLAATKEKHQGVRVYTVKPLRLSAGLKYLEAQGELSKHELPLIQET